MNDKTDINNDKCSQDCDASCQVMLFTETANIIYKKICRKLIFSICHILFWLSIIIGLCIWLIKMYSNS
jgi:hypothetical protein